MNGTISALLWALFGFAMFTLYVGISIVLCMAMRRQAMAANCVAKTRRSILSNDQHLYCSTLSGHWFFPVTAAILWPIALIPALVVRKVYHDELKREETLESRIAELERELEIYRSGSRYSIKESIA